MVLCSRSPPPPLPHPIPPSLHQHPMVLWGERGGSKALAGTKSLILLSPLLIMINAWTLVPLCVVMGPHRLVPCTFEGLHSAVLRPWNPVSDSTKRAGTLQTGLRAAVDSL